MKPEAGFNNMSLPPGWSLTLGENLDPRVNILRKLTKFNPSFTPRGEYSLV
jgi:hypothetical protein